MEKIHEAMLSADYNKLKKLVDSHGPEVWQEYREFLQARYARKQAIIYMKKAVLGYLAVEEGGV